jgi:beta-phosphoglucomutase-like phosphatase (HAD superfamily)
LFDFNGVLLDDETFHWRAFREVVRPFGIVLGRTRYNARYLVFDDRTALKAILRDARLDEACLERLLRRKRSVYANLVQGVRIASRAARLVRALARLVPVAIVSGARRREVETALGRARLTGAFCAIVTAEDVGRPKPWPDGYRLALRRLRLASGRDCVAIEDSPGGVAAARAAGLTVIGVTTTFSRAALRRAGAYRVVPALGALEVEGLWPREGAATDRSGPSGRRPTRRRW